MTKKEFWLKLFHENDTALECAIHLCERFVTLEGLENGKDFIIQNRSELGKQMSREIINHPFRRLEFSEIKELKAGDRVTICTYMDIHDKAKFIDATVIRPLFWNSDADEPDWEIETTNGFVDVYSVCEARRM